MRVLLQRLQFSKIDRLFTDIYSRIVISVFAKANKIEKNV